MVLNKKNRIKNGGSVRKVITSINFYYTFDYSIIVALCASMFSFTSPGYLHMVKADERRLLLFYETMKSYFMMQYSQLTAQSLSPHT